MMATSSCVVDRATVSIDPLIVLYSLIKNKKTPRKDQIQGRVNDFAAFVF